MPSEDTTTGATPGAGATPAQAGPQQPTNPPPTGATPPAGTSADPAADPSATDEGALGDAGKRILADARRAAKEAETRAKAAETERDALKAQTQTDQEKAIEAARKEAATEAESKWASIARRSQVERTLTAAGISQSELGLAAIAPEFAGLTLTDEGQVEDLDKAVSTFKKSHERLFEAPKQSSPGGAWGGSEGGGQPKPGSLEDAVAAALAKQTR